MNAVWGPVPPALPPRWAALLRTEGSFTEALSREVGAVQVRPLQEGWNTLHRDEAAAFGLTGLARIFGRAFVREVLLENAAGQWVFARSVIPAGSARGPNRELTHLGRTALGALLFAGEGRRLNLEYASLPGRHLLAQRMQALQLPFLRALPARRSLFEYRQKPLLVQEVLLPDLLQWRNQAE